MNLRKKNQKVNYQNPESLTKNLEYQELTKGKFRQETSLLAGQPPESNDQMTLIFTQLMKSIRRNLEQPRAPPNVPESQSSSEQQQDLAMQSGQIKKKLRLGSEQIKQCVQIKNTPNLYYNNSTVPKQKKLYRFRNHTVDQLKSIGTKPNGVRTVLQQSIHAFLPDNSIRQIQTATAQNPTIPATNPFPQSPLPTYKFFMSNSEQSTTMRQAPVSKPRQYVEPQPNDKLFNRSSFHVAIAYYIHFKQKQLCKDPMQIDPTYQARKFKKILFQ